MKLHPFIAIGFVLVVSFFATLFYFDRVKKVNTNDIKKQKTELSMDIGKLLFINTILNNPNKNRKYIDSVYEYRKDTLINSMYKNNQ